MPEKCLFLSSVLFDQSIIYADSEMGSLVAANLQKPEPEMKWRSSGNSNHRLVIHLPYAEACTAIAVIAHNGDATATMQVMGGNTENQVTGVDAALFDTTALSMFPPSGPPTAKQRRGYPGVDSLLVWSNATAYSWWSLTIQNPDGDDAWFEAGRVMIENAFRPSVNVGQGVGIQPITMGQQRRSDFNRIRTEARGPNARRMLLPFLSSRNTDFRENFLDFQMLHGVDKDFFFSLDPSADEDFRIYSMQALFEDTSQFTRQPSPTADKRWRSDLTIIQQT